MKNDSLEQGFGRNPLASESGVLNTTPAMLRAQEVAKESLVSKEGVLQTTPSMLRQEGETATANKVMLEEERAKKDGTRIGELKEKILGFLDRNLGKK